MTVQEATKALEQALTVFGQASYMYDGWAQRKQQAGLGVQAAEAALAEARKAEVPTPALASPVPSVPTLAD